MIKDKKCKPKWKKTKHRKQHKHHKQRKTRNGRGNNDVCSICYNNLRAPFTLKCKHKFHPSCIHKYARFNNSKLHLNCPMCRNSSNRKKVIHNIRNNASRRITKFMRKHKKTQSRRNNNNNKSFYKRFYNSYIKPCVGSECFESHSHNHNMSHRNQMANSQLTRQPRTFGHL